MKASSCLFVLAFGCVASALPNGYLPGNVIFLARPSRALERIGKRRQSNPPILSDGIASFAEAPVRYTSNWAGYAIVSTGITSAAGTFVVPTPHIPPGGSASTTYSMSVWVGIDGNKCNNVILQSGVDISVRGDTISFRPWYEWYPDYSYDFTGFQVTVGDVIRITVAGNNTSGSVTMENLSTGKTVSKSLSNQRQKLCGYNAEWIAEDFSQGGLVPFADFGNVTLFNASATASNGSVLALDNSEMVHFEIRQQSKILTNCSLANSSAVTCSYVR